VLLLTERAVAHGAPGYAAGRRRASHRSLLG
jgi:hypothetical protein